MFDKEKIITETLKESAEVKLKTIDACKDEILAAVHYLVSAFRNGKKLLLCGNGGSAADCQHIAAEFVIRLTAQVTRPSLPAIALTTDTSNLSAGGNDLGWEFTYSRILEGLGNQGDLLFALSTSGNSPNIIRTVEQAKTKKIFVVGFLGGNGGKLKDIVDLPIIIPSSSTARIQEAHITVGHIICDLVEKELFC
ncbi:MAG: SIS domain-containing protein [Bacteroidota bacterium]